MHLLKRMLCGLLVSIHGGLWATAVAGGPIATSEQRPVKIAVARFQHEATTFLPQKVGIEDFPKPDLSGDALLNSDDEAIRGFVKVAREHGGVEIVSLTSPGGPPIGGSSRGWITREAFEHYAQLMMADLRSQMPVDAVYLSLHGAAAVEGVARPEAELARRVREIVGDRAPIAGTFDPHGNEDAGFLRYANFSLVQKYYPHYDGRLQGERAARLLIRTARGDYRPTTATRKPGIITPTVVQWTGQYPWINLIQRALVWEARERDAYVSVLFGFPWSDVPDVGATVQVMTNGDQALADLIADDMAGYMWRMRRDLVNTTLVQAPDAAVAAAIAATQKKRTPVVLADYSDRAGDATHILSEIVRQDLSGVLYAALRDERVLSALEKEGARAGDTFDRDVGGFVMAPDSGAPVRIQGKLIYIGSPKGAGAGLVERGERVAIVEFGRGNWLVITPHLVQVTSPEQMDWDPIEPDRFTTWVLKSRVHFRRGFDDSGFAKTIEIVDAPGPFIGTVHLDELPYENVALRKLYPYSERQ